MVKSLSLIRCDSQTAWSPETALACDRPSGPAATLPVSSTRCIQPIAVLISTPNCLAA